MTQKNIGLMVHADKGPGILHQLTGVIAGYRGDITSIAIVDQRPSEDLLYFEIALPLDAEKLAADLRDLPIVKKVYTVEPLEKIYGKRIIIMGGGAQVGQVAIGAVSEADRHNIRGEHISVDTIPLVGEQTLADAVRAVARLPRAKALVLAGALMGGDIERAVREVRAGRTAGHQSEYGGKRSRCGRPGGDRSRAGRRHGRYGGGRYREVHRGAPEETGVLTRPRIAGFAAAPHLLRPNLPSLGLHALNTGIHFRHTILTDVADQHMLLES